ncbi:actinin alpha 2 [Geranomyces variabilis]|uniref:Actinin alpha 2 n=1 Tax=Geranomyces variabilis TaxID=109894 RepID=A0AAD5XMU2_9FUNG|nr:actinin alpha 2 [Geranomyces variabilis]
MEAEAEAEAAIPAAGPSESPEAKGKELKRIQMEAQKRTFTKWCNAQLRKLGTDEQHKIVDLAPDLRDGIRLSLLLEVLSGEKPPKPERAGGATTGLAVSRIYSIVNVDKCLKFLADRLREPLANIGSEDIVDGNLTLTMALIWVLILHFRVETTMDGGRPAERATSAEIQLPVSSASPASATSVLAKLQPNVNAPIKSAIGGKATLLNLCDRMLAPYVDVGLLSKPANFSESWQNGVAFLCLVHTFNPALLPEVTDSCRRLAAASLRAQRSSSRASRTSAVSSSTAVTPPRAFSPDSSALPSEPRFAGDEEWLKACSSPSPVRQIPTPRSPTRPSSLSISTTPTTRLSTVSNPSTPMTASSPGLAKSMDPSEWHKNLARAFGLAEEHMQVIPLLDPQDIADVQKPDELIIMTYVSELCWVLRSRPFPAANMFRAELAASSHLSESDAYKKRLVSTFLHHANRAIAWILKQQQATGALEGMLINVAANEVTKLIIPVEGWVKPIMESLMYEDSTFERVKGAVEERIRFMRGRLEAANAALPPPPPTWTKEALAQVDDVTAGAVFPFVHQLYNEIQRLAREHPLTPEQGAVGSPDPDAIMRKVEEKYNEVKTRLAYFCDEYFPDRDVVLRAYIVSLEQSVSKVDSIQQELLRSSTGVQAEIQRIMKQTEEIEPEISQLRADMSRLSSTEDERRAGKILRAVTSVVYDQLGGGQTSASFEKPPALQLSSDEQDRTPEALVALLQKLAAHVDDTFVQRVDRLRTRAAVLTQVLSNDIVNRRASLPANASSQDLHNEVFRPRSGGVWAAKGDIAAVNISFNFLPAFLVWRGRGIIEATTDSILTFISQSASPLLAERKAQISSLLEAARQRCREEEAHELQLRTVALEEALEYCQSVRRIDQAIKIGRGELENAQAAHEQKSVQADMWYASQTDAIAKLDAAWEKLLRNITRDSKTSAGLGAFAVNPPHQFLRNAMSALLMREVEQKRAQWENSATEMEKSIHSLSYEADFVTTVYEAAQSALQKTMQYRKQMVEALLASTRLEDALCIAETGLAAVDNDLNEVSAFIASRCEALESDAAAFERATWAPFQIHTETLMQSSAPFSESVEKRYTALKGLLAAARARRAEAHLSMEQSAKSLEQSYKWIIAFLTYEHKWLIDAREAENVVQAVEAEQARLMAAIKTVIYNSAHGQVMGQEDALLLHQSTGRKIEQQVSGLSSLIDGISEEPRVGHGGPPAPPRLIPMEAELRTGGEAVVNANVKNLQEARMAAGGRISALRNRLALEKTIGNFARGSSELISALKARLEVERNVKVPDGRALSADSAASAAAPSFLNEVKLRETETARAIAAIKVLANDCIDLAKRDGDASFVIPKVESAMSDLQVLADEITSVVLEVSAGYKAAALFAATVVEPGHKIEQACRDITAAVGEVAGFAADDHEDSDAGSTLAIVENIRVLADRATNLTLELDAIERAMDEADDNDYVKYLRLQVQGTQLQVEEAGTETVKAISGHWSDVVAAEVIAWVTRMSEFLTISEDNEEEPLEEFLVAMEKSLANLSDEMESLGSRLTKFQNATEVTIHALREWEARRTDSKRRVSILHPEAIQGRYVEIRTQADSLPRAIREGLAFASLVSSFVALAQATETTIANLDSRAAEDSTEAQLAELERSVVSGELAAALDGVRSAVGYGHAPAAQKCTKRFQNILHQIEKLRGTIMGSLQTRDAVQKYLNQAAEVRAWINDRLANLEVVTADVNAEAERILGAIRNGAVPVVEEAVTQRFVEREVGLASAQAALDRYNRAYEQLSSHADTITEAYDAGDATAADTVRQEQDAVNVQWHLMKERLSSLYRRVEWSRRALMWARRCETHIIAGIASAHKKVASGDFGAASVASFSPQLEDVDKVVDELCRALDMELRGWQEQAAAALVLSSELRNDDGAHDGGEQLLASLTNHYAPGLQRELSLLETAVLERQKALRICAESVREFLSKHGECGPAVESVSRELRERLYPRKNAGSSTPYGSRGSLTRAGSRMSMGSLASLVRDAPGGTPSASGPVLKHLVITGKDDADISHLEDWTAHQQRIAQRLDELSHNIEALKADTAVKTIRDCATINGHSARVLGRDIQDRMETLSEKWREATRLAHEENFGIDRAHKYHNWHSVFGRIEAETAAIEDAVDGATETEIDQLNVRLTALERALLVFTQMTEQDKLHQASTNQAEPEDGKAERKDTGALRKHSSLSNLKSCTLAERENANILQERRDALSARIARLAFRLMETRDELGNKRRLMTMLEEVSRLSGWCERKEMEVLARQSLLPPQALLDDRPYMRPAEEQSATNASQDVHEKVQADLKDTLTQNTLMEYELGQSRAALLRLEEKMDPAIFTQLEERCNKIENLIAVEKKNIESTKQLYMLDLAMCSLTNWISAAIAAANEIAAMQRILYARPQSIVLDEHSGDSEDNLAGAGTYEDVVELEDRIRVYEDTVTSFFNSATSTSENLSITDTLDAPAYRASVSWRTERVRSEWEFLLALVGSLRGSSEDRRREVELNEEVDEITRGLEYVQSLITSGMIAEKWDETEELLDSRMLPRVAALRRRSESAARDARERKRFLAKHQSLERWTKSLLEQVQSRHARAEPALMDRRVSRLVEEIDTCIAEFDSIVRKAAAGAAAAAAMAEGIPLPAAEPTRPVSPTSPAPPSTSTDFSTLSNALNQQAEEYEGRMRQLLARLREACEAAEDDKAVATSLEKWEAARTWKMQVAKELTRLKTLSEESEAEQRETDAWLSRRSVGSSQPRTPSVQADASPSPSVSRRGLESRPRSASTNEGSADHEPSSFSPKRSQLPRPFSRSRSITPISMQSSPARRTSEPESPSHKAGRTFTVILPKPNHYTPNRADPLDVAIAEVVNSFESPIRIEKSNTQPGRYWFGDALRRLCLCRLVRRTVVIRIGGGWQDLATFLTDHGTLELRVPVVRSFSSPNHFETTGPTVPETANPYALTSASKVAKALAKITARKAQD